MRSSIDKNCTNRRSAFIMTLFGAPALILC